MIKATSGAVILALAIAMTAPGIASADPKLSSIRAALAKEGDARGRQAQIPRILQVGGRDAAALLGSLVEGDAAMAVRLDAARALGRIEAPNAATILVERVIHGGPRALRRALGRSLAERTQGVRAAMTWHESDGATEAEHVLLYRAFAAFTDRATFELLATTCRSKDDALRGAALVALAARRDRPERRLSTMVRLLSEVRGTEATLATLDAFAELAHPTMKPALERLATSLEPNVQDAAGYMLARLRFAKAQAKPKPKAVAPDPADPDERYAENSRRDDVEDPRPPVDDPAPTPRNRFDVVYAIDATGSAGPNLERIRERIESESSLVSTAGLSVRVGIVVYRGGKSRTSRARSIEVLQPCFDMARVRAFLADVKARGVDDRGAAVAPALHQALDRTPWRWKARRVVQLFADGGIDDPKTAERTVGVHFAEDRTRTRVGYMLRTRTRVPGPLSALAQRGGTGVVERIE